MIIQQHQTQELKELNVIKEETVIILNTPYYSTVKYTDTSFAIITHFL